MTVKLKYLISISTLIIYFFSLFILNGLEYLDFIITLIDNYLSNFGYLNFYYNYNVLIQRFFFGFVDFILLVYVLLGIKFKFYNLKYKKVDTMFYILLSFFILVCLFTIPSLIIIIYEELEYFIKYKL